MAIKMVQIESGFFATDDCIVLKNAHRESGYIVMALPFHEDTPNLTMTISQAVDLRNALDALVKVPLIEHNKEGI